MHILMITIGYPPLQVGGTEVYVFGLVEALKQKGHVCSVVYIEAFDDDKMTDMFVTSRRYHETAIHTIHVNTAKHQLEFLLFDSKLRGKLIDAFLQVASEVQPDVIHVHPLQLGFDSYLIEKLNHTGQKVLFTFHSSTTTCARGDLIYLGKKVCDGLVLQDRCTKCFYQWKSVPVPLAASLAKLPVNWFRTLHSHLESHERLKKLRSFVSVPLIIEERRKSWTRATDNARAIVAVCEWVRNTIVSNGVREEKVTFSRHGLRLCAERNGHKPDGPARFGYLGRVSPEKGVGVLVKVLEQMDSGLEFEFEFCSSSFRAIGRRPEENDLVQSIYHLCEKDKRIRVLDNVSDTSLGTVLSKWDAMVVPSLWLESGPQVIYEAFAVRTPILGSRLGGIAEIVREGETGYLCDPNSVHELAKLLNRFAVEPAKLRLLRDNITPVRTTSDVAEDMLGLYQQVLRAAV